MHVQLGGFITKEKWATWSPLLILKILHQVLTKLFLGNTFPISYLGRNIKLGKCLPQHWVKYNLKNGPHDWTEVKLPCLFIWKNCVALSKCSMTLLCDPCRMCWCNIISFKIKFSCGLISLQKPTDSQTDQLIHEFNVGDSCNTLHKFGQSTLLGSLWPHQTIPSLSPQSCY